MQIVELKSIRNSKRMIILFENLQGNFHRIMTGAIFTKVYFYTFPIMF